MPPVAKDFREATDDLFDQAAGGIDSVRALARRLRELDERQTEDSWLRTVRRWRGPVRVDEESLQLVARAFQVDRERLPAAPPPVSLNGLAGRLEALEALVAEGENERTRLAAQLRRQAAVLRRLAKLVDIPDREIAESLPANGDVQ